MSSTKLHSYYRKSVLTADEIALKFPRLFHVTTPGARVGIEKHGLLSASAALDLFDIDSGQREKLTRNRRAQSVPVEHKVHGRIVLNDNSPLSEVKLAKCLDDGMTPQAWLELLNGFVFFWPSEKRAGALANAIINQKRPRELLIFDTRSLLEDRLEKTYFSPINSGSTIHVPARRGKGTFSPVAHTSYFDWSRKRAMKRPDRVAEIVVKHSVPDAADHLIEVRRIGG